MIPGDPMKDVANGVSALGEVVALAKDSPEAREAGVYAAKSLRIVSQTLHTLLLPLAAANYGAQKFADYMTKRFGPELEEALADVPEEGVREPRLNIAGPVLDALVYSHEDDELRRLYMSLLARSMDSRAMTTPHPAFVEVLKQLDSAELPMLRAVLEDGTRHRSDAVWPIVRVGSTTETGSKWLHTNVVDWRQDGHPVQLVHSQAYLDNWVRLGLVEIDYDNYLVTAGAYGWVDDRPEYQQIKRVIADYFNDEPELDLGKGMLHVTDWGLSFARAVSLDKVPPGFAVQEIGAFRA